jgi:endonuclease YncB( thermonuclease family)
MHGFYPRSTIARKKFFVDGCLKNALPVSQSPRHRFAGDQWLGIFSAMDKKRGWMRGYAHLITIAAIIAISSDGVAQKPSAQPEGDPCGDPNEGSTVLQLVIARVVQVVDGQTIIVASKPGDRIKVHLADIAVMSIDQPLGREAKSFLEKLLGDHVIAISVNDMNEPTTSTANIIGIVRVGTDGPIAQLELIHTGLAKFTNADRFTMSSYLACQCDRLEKEAHAAKRGVWAEIEE